MPSPPVPKGGMWKDGKPPEIEAMSPPTVGTSMPSAITSTATIPIPASGAGTSFVTLGVPR